MKNLVMIGACRAHVQVLQSMAMLPLPGVEVKLVTSCTRYVCPSMLSGFVAGHWQLDDCAVALTPLLDAAGVKRVPRSVATLDATNRCIVLDDGSNLSYDVLSVDCGHSQERQQIEKWMPGAREHALFVRPEEVFCSLWPKVLTLAQSRPLRVSLIGGDSAAVEMAFAVAHRLQGSSITLLSGSGLQGDKYPPKFHKRVLYALKQHNITVIPERCVGVAEGEVTMTSGARLACDVPIVVLGSHAPTWLLDSGMAHDGHGSILVDSCLRSTSHGEVLAVGQRCTLSAPASPGSVLPTANVGVSLADNLRAILAGISPKPLVPKANSLEFLSFGTQGAIAQWGSTCVQGRWVGWVKDWWDCRSMASLRVLPRDRCR